MRTNFQTKEQCLKELEEAYVRPSHPIAFSGIDNIYHYFRGILSKSEIELFLSKNQSYTSHRVPRKGRRNVTFVHSLREKISCDLIEVSKISSYNDNIKFILTVIDIFSRRAFARNLKSKKSDEVCQNFRSILEEAGNKPIKSVFCDKGGEFISKVWIHKNFLHVINVS